MLLNFKPVFRYLTNSNTTEMAEQYKKLQPLKYYKDYLIHNIRPDGRELLKYRPVVINVNSIQTADGSAIAKFGGTTVVCGIKAELCTPKAEGANKGFLVPNITLPALCSSKFRPGPPCDEAQVASQIVCNILENSEYVNLEQLCIAYDKLAWVLYCDMICLNYDGCLIDVCVAALSAALRTVQLPTVEYDVDTESTVVYEDKKKPLSLGIMPAAHTFSVFDDKWLLADPTEEEESLSTAMLTIVTTGEMISLMHKPGGTPINQELVSICTSESKKRAVFINKASEKALQSVNLL
ncbi:exosome complex component RRP43-like [Ctenocephalides felis]|uniref:exosome complex component RRP43-like n=1 Tax=Ctenocephalides felis TaxID=7515 RepID=UPI000E6E30F7|nr:exosome complex component RRP43-like [Ctenocephalides felis]XP_026466147.1 exosome complex component RRP43-like [Ctenocephalides felis]